MKNKLQLFQNQKIRAIWDSNIEEWYFSIVDVVATLTESVNPTDYLKKMRKRDILLNDYLGTNCPQVSMQTESGKIRNILAGTTKQVLRIIQSIPSQKAEPFKIWLKHLLLSCQKHTIRKILSRTKQLRNKAVRLLAMPARALKSRVAVQ